MRKILTILTILLLVQFSFNLSAECIKGDCVNGQGTYIYSTGAKYVGGWKNTNIHGQGTFTSSDGNQWKLLDGQVIANPNYIKSSQSYSSQTNNSESTPSYGEKLREDIKNSIVETGKDYLLYKLLGLKPTWNMRLVRADQFSCTYEDKDGREITLPRKVKSSSAKLKTDPFFGGESIKTTTKFEKCD